MKPTSVDQLRFERRPAQLYQVDYRNALQDAARVGNYAAINRITDDLARMGLCRKRTEDGLFKSVAERGEVA